MNIVLHLRHILITFNCKIVSVLSPTGFFYECKRVFSETYSFVVMIDPLAF